MNLSVQIAVLKQRDGTRAARITVIGTETPEPIHSSLEPVEVEGSRAAAEYRAMLRAIEIVAVMRPESVEFRCPSPRVADQLSGLEPVDPAVEDLFDQVSTALLKIDVWSVAR